MKPAVSAGVAVFRSATLALALLPGIAGCAFWGPDSLRADQVDYARALADAKKREILSMVVGLRYADAPAFINVTQIIAAYTMTATAGGVLNSLPDPGGPAAGATGMLSYSNHPTFTFTPTTGEAFAKAYIHPLAPGLILPLAGSGIPIDLLLRIAVQSIGSLHNATMLGGSSGSGSPGFFELLRVLRRLQLAGAVAIAAATTGGEVSLVFSLPAGAGAPAISRDVDAVRRLLDLAPGPLRYPLLDASVARSAAELGGAIPITTRSVLAILSDLGAEVIVPGADVASGATQATIALTGGETRPVMVVHAGHKAPPDAYVAVRYRDSEFWIEGRDFDSKYALSVVQNLMALAEVTDTARAPLVTVPAN